MDKFEQLFKQNKSSFDRLDPAPESWGEIMKSLDDTTPLSLPKHRGRNFLFIRIAAGILLLLGLYAALSTGGVHIDEDVFDRIALDSPEGNTIPLDPSLNKYTLVQFWESGNVLCTDENCYYYLPAYEKYKEHGFEIYAISLDKNKESWVLGIEENDLPWIHVSDLKGWQSPICIECNITKVPTSFLLDNKGEIIARDLSAEDLEETLDRLLAQN